MLLVFITSFDDESRAIWLHTTGDACEVMFIAQLSVANLSRVSGAIAACCRKIWEAYPAEFEVMYSAISGPSVKVRLGASAHCASEVGQESTYVVMFNFSFYAGLAGAER